jgi:hypothetical protein
MNTAATLEPVALVTDLAAWKIKSATKDIEEYAAKVLKDPAHALSWGSGAFEAAATIKVWSEVKQWLAAAEERKGDLTPETVVAKIVEQMTREALRGALYPARSTSVTSNLMEQEVLAARARLLDDLKSL